MCGDGSQELTQGNTGVSRITGRAAEALLQLQDCECCMLGQLKIQNKISSPHRFVRPLSAALLWSCQEQRSSGDSWFDMVVRGTKCGMVVDKPGDS